MEKNQESAGEDLIADFLEESSIKFKRYYKLPILEGDDKAFREADFYLPEYKVYIEFLGKWNDPEHQREYRKKMAIYDKNGIHCAYIFPDNLGTLDWMLRRRLRETFLKYNKKFTLLKYEYENYTQEYGLILIGFGVLIYFVKQFWWRIAIILLLLYILYTGISKYWKRLQKLKKSKWVMGWENHKKCT